MFLPHFVREIDANRRIGYGNDVRGAVGVWATAVVLQMRPVQHVLQAAAPLERNLFHGSSIVLRLTQTFYFVQRACTFSVADRRESEALLPLLLHKPAQDDDFDAVVPRRGLQSRR